MNERRSTTISGIYRTGRERGEIGEKARNIPRVSLDAYSDVFILTLLANGLRHFFCVSATRVSILPDRTNRALFAQRAQFEALLCEEKVGDDKNEALGVMYARILFAEP